MYTPPSNVESRPAVLAEWIKSYPFASLISHTSSGPEASHLPLLIDTECTRLRGHMARANKQWQRFTDDPVLTIFQGPHAYISPTFFNSPCLRGTTLPCT